ncbi:hypothetical protein C8J56DRAFT_831969 [Mycena floridula]|nr:hypothetical protein C8J56DRAFT_831969 [Mycena floridula]
MYSPHFETPPQSQFKRPWSPDPFDPLPPSQFSRAIQNESQFLNQHRYSYDQERPMYPPRQQRREPSEVSVEALDLADYARTLRPHRNDRHHQNYPEDMHMYSPPLRPQSRDSLQAPSLISRGDTLSSNTHSSQYRYPSRRPFSLPPRSRPTSSPQTVSHRYPNFHDPRFSSVEIQQPDGEIDVSQFPPWSRNWYNTPKSPPDIYTSLPKSQFDKRSPFDPGNTMNTSPYGQYDYDPYGYDLPSTSYGHESNRDVLPWSNDPPDYGQSIDPSMKEERLRMLEREFGPNAVQRNRKDEGFVDDEGKPLIGTVNVKGQLVTQGPRKRTAARVFQILLAIAAAVPSIYAAMAIKPEKPAPPSGTPAAYVLYVISVITLLGLLGIFVIRPCCGGSRSKSDPGNPMANGMMVLPVQGLPGGKKAKGKGQKKGKKGQGGGGDVQVNLIVDPTMFGGGRRDEETEEEEDESNWDGSMPGGYAGSKKKRKRAPQRRSVFAGLAMEEQWKKARAWTKKVTVVDVFGLVVWGAVFVFILIGKRCPSGGFNGWCTAYNVSSAAAFLLCVAFGISVFFDIKDLHTSKISPRTRT